MSSPLFTSVVSLIHTLLVATLLLVSSLNDDEPSYTVLSLSIFVLLILNVLLHYRVDDHTSIIIQRKLNNWKRIIGRINSNMKCTVFREDGTTEEILFYDLTTDDIVVYDEKFSFILDYLSDETQHNHKIRISQPATYFLYQSLKRKHMQPPIFETMSKLIDKFDKIIFPIVGISAIFGVFCAFLFSESKEEYANERFGIQVCLLTVIPLLRINLPLFTLFHILCDNLAIKYHLSNNKSISSIISLINFEDLLIDCNWSSLALRLSEVTGVCAIDKKGILATSEPVLEKIFIVHSNEEGDTNGKVLQVTCDIGSSTISNFSFDDADWYYTLNSLCPLSESIQLNSCTKDMRSANCLCPIRQLIPSHSSDDFSKSFNKFRKTIGEDVESEYPLEVECCRVKEKEMYRIHLRGSPSLILPLCLTYWDGTEVKAMNDKVIGLATNFASRHTVTSHCVAISCGSSIYEKSSNCCEYTEKNLENKFNQNISSVSEFNISSDTNGMDSIEQQTFLALTASQEQALPFIFEMIESLKSSCIRFILFSKENQLRSRIIGEKLGLEAGWNCHISLKNETSKKAVRILNGKGRRESCPNGKSIHSLTTSIPSLPPNMARLPIGIEHIRPHLERVDNVPLLVSLFTDCTVDATREMIDILHENDECQLVIGSLLSPDNMLTLMKGIVSIGIYPLSISACQYQSEEIMDEGGIASLSTDLIIHQSQISRLPYILSFSRQKASLFNQYISFYLISSFSISLHNLFTLMLKLPFPISSFNMILVTFVIHPLLTLSILFHNDFTDRLVPSSTPSLLFRPINQFFFYHFPHLIALSITHISMLTQTGQIPCLPFLCEWILPQKSQASMNQIESLISFLRIISLILISSTHIYPYNNSLNRLPFFTPIWSIVVLFSLSLQFYCSHSGFLTVFSPLILLIYIILSSISLVIAQSYKRTNIRIFKKENRRKKFGFDTKLGMNSPY